MSNETESNVKRLTLDDPVGKEVLERFSELENITANIGIQFIELEQEKVKLLAAKRKVDDERQRIFEKLLMDRGLPPNTPANIDAQTGKMSLIQMPGQPPQATPNGSSPAPQPPQQTPPAANPA